MFFRISNLFFLVFLFLVAGPWSTVLGPAFAAKTTYIYTDRKYHFIKRVELKKKELKERGAADHPHTFNPLALRDLLSGIEISKQLILSKKMEGREVFDQPSLDFLVPHLVAALSQAAPAEQVVFSFILRKSRAVFQDTRLTLAEAWVKDGFLHVYFRKLMAKIDLTKDDKFADVSRAINRARGLRVSLELKEGQQFGESTDEILLPVAGVLKKDRGPETVDRGLEEEGSKRGESKKETEVAVKQEPPGEIETRLRELDSLKEKGLISKKEYEAKKKGILRDL
ncbi:MAG: SHOCT domain-containing protein [Deltaproteobacteria bacterium]|nr:SHOCT domain-containing protein [Deltaproteobacteria bacterium]